MNPTDNFDIAGRPEKITNEYYEEDIRYMVRYTKWFLEVLGLWPMLTRQASPKIKYLSKLLILVCLGSMAFIVVPMAFHIVFRVRDIVATRIIVGMISPCLASVLKYSFMIHHSKTIKLCVEHMETDWMNVVGENDRAIMRKNVKVEHVITAASSLFLYTGGIFYHAVMPLLKGSTINSRNETIRPLVYPGYDFFVNPQTSPNYEIIFSAICFAAFVRFTVTLAACNLTALLVTHACGQMQIVVSRLEKLFHEIDEMKHQKELEKRMSFLILCHVRGLRLSSIIDEALREICLIEVVAATLILCLLEYYVMEWQNAETVTTITYFLLLASYTYNIFIFCHIGELFKEQFQEVGRAAYMIEWYRIPEKKGLCIVMIMAMANYPQKITAGGLIELSIYTFGVIMKTSVVYQNMLRTIA